MPHHVGVSSSPELVGTLRSSSAIREYARLEPDARSADLVEVRLDLIPQAEWKNVFQACDRLEATGTRVLSTIRLSSDGGAWEGSDSARRRAFKRVLEHSSWVDVEVSSTIASAVCSEAHSCGKKALVSFHDFSTTPSRAELEEIYTRCLAHGADIAKIATMTHEIDHHSILVDLVARHGADGKLCAVGMGAHGLALRLFLPVIGSIFAYGYLDEPSAPGQISCSHLLEILRLQIPRFNEKYLMRTKSLEAA